MTWYGVHASGLCISERFLICTPGLCSFSSIISFLSSLELSQKLGTAIKLNKYTPKKNKIAIDRVWPEEISCLNEYQHHLQNGGRKINDFVSFQQLSCSFFFSNERQKEYGGMNNEQSNFREKKKSFCLSEETTSTLLS